ncbi:MAG: putative ThiS family protein [Dehalococcoidia bacterium]|nr:putative ThiS family protein [Dehalococcoidia bacterium]
MSVKIEIPQFLQHLTNGVKVAKANGNTVGECLADLIRQFPQLRELILDENGKLLKYVEVSINGVSTYPQELANPVKDSDVIYIFHAIAGGCAM